MRLAIGAVIGFMLALVLTPAVGALARRARVIDRITKKPLFGGTAIFLAVTIAALAALFAGWLPAGFVPVRSLVALTIGGLILILGGALDDRYNLKPSRQIIFPVLAAVVAVTGGISISYVRNPFGGIIHLNSLGPIITFFWLLGLMYTTKILDGLDGLVAGLGVIAATIMIFVALRPELAQPGPALLSSIIDGALVGFLVWNFPPARVFLGEGGSTYVGYLVGALAVIAGSKVATTLLVLAIPIFDLAWVVVRRLFVERRSLARGDRKHLHFRLLDAGFSARAAVLALYAFGLILGLVGLLTDTLTKTLVLTIIFLSGILFAAAITRREKV